MTAREDAWGDDGPIVGAAWLRTHLADPDVRVIDARPFGQYAAGHIPGAIHWDLYALKLLSSAAAAIADFGERVQAELRRAGVRPEERVVFYEEISGTSAARGVWLLDYADHRRGALLDGGLVAWMAGGGTLTTEVPAVAPSDWTIAPDRGVLATAPELLAGLGTDGAPAILDTRGDQEYAAGTIPGATHVEWTHNLKPDGTLAAPQRLRALYRDAGIEPEAGRSVVTFCATGYRAAHAYLVLRALGCARVQNYAPSWAEWGRAGLPVITPDDLG